VRQGLLQGEEQERSHEGARQGGGREAASEAAGRKEQEHDVPAAADADAVASVQAAVPIHGQQQLTRRKI